MVKFPAQGLPVAGGGGAACVFDTQDKDEQHPTQLVQSLLVEHDFNPPAAFQTEASITVTVANDDSTVALFGCATSFGTPHSLFVQITEGATIHVPSTAQAGAPSVNLANVLTVNSGIITGVSAGVHTYNCQVRSSPSGINQQWFTTAGISAIVLG